MKALKIDFTGKQGGEFADFTSFKEFAEGVVDLVRKGEAKTVVVLDKGYDLPGNEPHLVSDHLNFTGTSPLCGPNHPCGERFPVVNDIYKTDFGKAKKGIVAGLKKGVTPDASDKELMKKLGAEFYSYNLVETMLVAAHAGMKVVGILVPEDGSGKELVDEILHQCLKD